MRADDRSDLGDEDRLGAEDLTAAVGEPLGDVGRLDVLDRPRVGAVVVAGAGVVHHPLERARRGADPLDRGDLAADREDRLDPQRAPDPRLRAADPPAAAQVLERVDREPDLRRLDRLLGPRADRVDVAARLRGGRRRQDAEAEAAARRPRVHDRDSPVGVAGQGVGRRLARALYGARDVARQMDRDDVAPRLQERLVDGEEVADRRLRGGRQLIEIPQTLVVGVEVRHVGLALLGALPGDVERHGVDVMGGQQLPREIAGRVRDHGDIRHRLAP